jgi:hypothetical protein
MIFDERCSHHLLSRPFIRPRGWLAFEESTSFLHTMQRDMVQKAGEHDARPTRQKARACENSRLVN